MPVSRLREQYGRDWIENQLWAGVSSVVHHAEQSELLTMQGAIRDCHFGPRFVGELMAAGPREEWLQRMLAAFRRVQWWMTTRTTSPRR